MKLFDRWKDSFNPRPCTWITKGTTYFSPWTMSTGNRVRYLISMVVSILFVAILFGAMCGGFNFALGTGIEAIYPVGFDLIKVFWMSFGLGFLLVAIPFTVAQFRYWFSAVARIKAYHRSKLNVLHDIHNRARREGVDVSNVEIVTPGAAEKQANAAAWAGEEVVDAEFDEVVDPNRTLH